MCNFPSSELLFITRWIEHSRDDRPSKGADEHLPHAWCDTERACNCRLFAGQRSSGPTEALLQPADGVRGGPVLQRGARLRAAGVGKGLPDGYLLRGREDAGAAPYTISHHVLPGLPWLRTTTEILHGTSNGV